MVTLRGHFGAGPLLRGAVEVVGVGSFGDISFLLDTGAQFSVLHPQDIAQIIGFAFDAVDRAADIDELANAVDRIFSNLPPVYGAGIGGAASYVEANCLLGFVDENSAFQTFRLPMFIAIPDLLNAAYPSFLGMDFLSHFDIHLNHATDLVTLEFVD